MNPTMPVSNRRFIRCTLILSVVLGAAAAVAPAPRGQTPSPPASPPSAAPGEPGAPAPETEPLVPAATDPGETPSGALAFFMGSRDYRTIRDLKSILTPQAAANYDHDSVTYNGRKGVRLAAWDYKEPAPKPGALAVTSTVRSLWEDQGEGVEERTESVRMQRDATGPWRVASLMKGTSQTLRFKDAVPGVTSLRQALRAWQKRDLASAQAVFSDAFVKRIEPKGGLAALLAPPEGKRHAAFRIQSYEPKGTTGAVAKVGLVDVVAGRPGPLDGTPRTLTLVKRGSRWLLDDWR
jgi:hypothetical protein